MVTWLDRAACLAGAGLVVAGVSVIHGPSGLIVAGLLLLAGVLWRAGR